MPNAGSHNIYHFLIYMLSNLKRLSGDVPDIIYIHIGAKFVEDILRAIYPKTTILDSEKRHSSMSPNNLKAYYGDMLADKIVNLLK